MNLYESIKNNLKETNIVDKDNKRYMEIDLKDEMTEEVVRSVFGQLSDGIWENSPAMRKYWQGVSFADNKLLLDIYNSVLTLKDEAEINKFLADKIKKIVKKEIEYYPETGEWSRDNENKLKFMGKHIIREVRVKDAYRVYDDLLGRVVRVQDSEENNLFNKSWLSNLKEEFWDTMDTDEDIEDVAYENLYTDINKYINEKGLKNKYNPDELEIFKENIKKWVISEDSVEEFNPMTSIQEAVEENTDNLTFDTLSEDQKRELKERYYTEKNENVSWGELADIDNLVSDEELRAEYGNVSFVKDDFFTETENFESKNTDYDAYAKEQLHKLSSILNGKDLNTLKHLDEAYYPIFVDIIDASGSDVLVQDILDFEELYFYHNYLMYDESEITPEEMAGYIKKIDPTYISNKVEELKTKLSKIDVKDLDENETNRNNLKIVKEVIEGFNRGTEDKYDLAVRTEDEGTIIIYDKYENFSYEYFDTEYFGIEDFENDFDDLQNTLAAALKKSLYLEEQSPCVYVIAVDTEDGSETLKETSEEEKVEIHDKMQDEYNKIFGLKEGSISIGKPMKTKYLNDFQIDLFENFKKDIDLQDTYNLTVNKNSTSNFEEALKDLIITITNPANIDAYKWEDGRESGASNYMDIWNMKEVITAFKDMLQKDLRSESQSNISEGALSEEDTVYIKIDTNRDGYNPNQVSSTLTVGELLDELNQYDEDAKVFLSFDNDYTYGGINSENISQVIVDNEELEETENMQEPKFTLEISPNKIDEKTYDMIATLIDGENGLYLFVDKGEYYIDLAVELEGVADDSLETHKPIERTFIDWFSKDMSAADIESNMRKHWNASL